MHPAYSILLFTTASGAGFGLLVWLCIALALGIASPSSSYVLPGLILALALIAIGLLSSLLHLGRPERAWRALSQWRSSWLSREGIAAIATYVPAGILGLGLIFGEVVPGQIMMAAWLTIPLALLSVWCTGMIYASLPTIRAWHHPLVAPIYIALSLATGSVLLCALLMGFGHDARWGSLASVLALAAGWTLKAYYWSAIDQAKRTHTAEAATGLGGIGTVRPLDPPHTQPNFVMREMGYQVARKHARTLRLLTMALLFAFPIAAALLPLVAIPHAAKLFLALVAVISTGIGVLFERWLFFAEAEHVVTVYYRGGAA